MSQKSGLCFIVLILCVINLYRGGCTIVDLRPSESRIDNSPIDPSLDPIQTNKPTDFNSSFIKIVDGVKVLITPLAEYEISGRVERQRH